MLALIIFETYVILVFGYVVISSLFFWQPS